MLLIVSITAEGIRLPPGVPTTIISFPSLVTIVGVIDDSGRLPGATALFGPSTRPYMLGAPGYAAQARRRRRAIGIDPLAKLRGIAFVDEVRGIDGDEARIAEVHIAVV